MIVKINYHASVVLFALERGGPISSLKDILNDKRNNEYLNYLKCQL